MVANVSSAFQVSSVFKSSSELCFVVRLIDFQEWVTGYLDFFFAHVCFLKRIQSLTVNRKRKIAGVVWAVCVLTQLFLSTA